jgi:hypothetical protein
MNRLNRWLTDQFKINQWLIGTAVVTVLLGLVVVFVSTQRLAIRSGFMGWARLSPFTDVRCEEKDLVNVEFENSEYQLVSIADIPTSAILATCRDEFGDWWEKRFVEDPVEVLILAGHRPGQHVKLVLRQTDGSLKVVPAAPLTAENRKQAYDARSARLKMRETEQSGPVSGEDVPKG